MRFVLLALLFSCLALPALAESSAPNPLHYTAIGQKKSADSQHMKSMNYYTREAPEAAEGKKEDTPETPSEKVWNKYKALAAGQYKDEEEQKPAEAEKKTAETAKEQPKQAGFASILEEYREKKALRSQMRTITVKQPEKPAAKPEG